MTYHALIFIMVTVITPFFPSTATAEELPGPPGGSRAFWTRFHYLEGLDGGSMLGVNLGASWALHDRLFLDVSMSAWDIEGEGAGEAAWTGLGLRWSPYYSGGLSAWLYARSGPLYANERLPSDGTRFNFLSEGGIGASLRVSERLYFMGELGAGHISNGGMDDDNPGIDGWSTSLGLMFTY